MKWNVNRTHWELGKIRAPDGIRTHEPQWSSRMFQPLNYWKLYQWAWVKRAIDSSCIPQLQSQITTDSIAHNCIAQSHKAYLRSGQPTTQVSECENDIHISNEMLIEPIGNPGKSETQMGFEPTTLRDLVGRLEHPTRTLIFFKRTLTFLSWGWTFYFFSRDLSLKRSWDVLKVPLRWKFCMSFFL